MKPNDTAFMKAVISIFEKIGDSLPPLKTPVKGIMVGGAAVHFYTQSRVSKDVEAIYSHRLILPQDLVIRYTDDSGQSRTLAYDYNYFSDIALMHPDYEKDARDTGIVIKNKLHLFVLSPVDLAVSKLARFQDYDQQDIIELARQGLLKPKELKKRAHEALDYYVGNTQWIEHNISDAADLVSRFQPKRKPSGENHYEP